MFFEVWLRTRMTDRGVDNKALAKAISVDATTVGRWAEGETEPVRKYVLRLSQFFKVSPVTILRFTDPDEYYAEAGSQEELEDILAELPELRKLDRMELSKLLKRSRGMTPEKRAAWLLILKDGGKIPEDNPGEGGR